MPRFAANLTWLFREYPFIERFAEAAAHGFRAVELLYPYDHPAQDILGQLRRHDLTLVLFNCPPPNYTGGQPGFAAQPGQQDRFRRDFRRSLRYADRLDPAFLHVMAGEAKGPEARRSFVDNLRWAAETAEDRQLTIEPINPTDLPGYFLNDFDLAADILEEVGKPNLNLQFDVYHAQMITGDAMATWDKHGRRAVHVQVAGTPGRNEPVRGDIDYPAFFAQLDAEHYAGWVSGEYSPAARTEDGLDWMMKSC